MENYLKVIEILRQNGNVYIQTPYYNYSPFWSFWLLACSYVANWLNLSIPFVIRATLSIFNAFNALIIFRISERITGLSMVPVAFYALNPAIILTVGYHGQFEVLAMFPVLLAIDLHLRVPSQSRIWLLGTLAILIKQIVLFNVLTLFVYAVPTKRRSVLMIILSVIVFFLSFLPYLSSSRQIGINVFGHAGDIGSFGIARQLPVFYTMPLFLVGMTLFPFLSKYRFNLTILEGLLVSSLAFVVFAPGFYAHYLVIPILAGALVPSVYYYIFIFISLDAILRYHFGKGMPLIIAPLTWLYAAIFFAKHFLIFKRPSWAVHNLMMYEDFMQIAARRKFG